MSYILDALKKADAQRERDPARGIHAQPAPLPTLQQPGLGQRSWSWVAAAAALAALAAAGWYLSRQGDEVQRPTAAVGDAAASRSPGVPPAAPAPLPTAAPLATAAAVPEPPADAVLPPPVAAAPPVVATVQGKAAAPVDEKAAARGAPAAKASAVAAAPAAVPAAMPPTAASLPPAAAAVPIPAPAGAPPASAAPVAPPVAAAPPATAAVAAPAASAAPITNGLPSDAPKLAISGGVYSANRAQRMLIVNGQVVNEGADLGGGIVLEEIRPKAAVLRFRGGRYNVGF